ncbi:MAG: hypothetical protein VB934_16105, partial [Polyangiaceae bacterium]
MKRTVLIAAIGMSCGVGGACVDDQPGPASDTQPDPNVRYLSDADYLVRASMALRGVRPTITELQAVREDPKVIEGLVDG